MNNGKYSDLNGADLYLLPLNQINIASDAFGHVTSEDYTFGT